ncbi:MAG: cytochrome C [Bdellovibrionales bacterium]|nr:cytochrome C [Bdellovibrionales bacterium]MBT3525347.1 cytochrome C [Bdellovibrionales bacterium]MBT7668988.1 cytochrome C [Bdellovibrionales bacterium]MBT7765503.1 cytochrome C [Bdellovibrionales bacterium]
MKKYNIFNPHYLLRSAILVALSTLLGVSLNFKVVASDTVVLSDIKSEAGMFLPLKEKVKKSKKKKVRKGKKRRLKSYYALRAFHGAPPTIPHSIKNKKGKRSKCLSCHKKDRYISKYKSYAPLTPHPEYIDCGQCHVLANRKNGIFKKGISWKSYNPPKTNRSVFPGAPMSVPHSFQFREACSKCHVGPTALKEVRTKHPERLNCRQCHINQLEQTSWQR